MKHEPNSSATVLTSLASRSVSYPNGCPSMQQPNTISLLQAERVAEILSEREGVQFKFFRFLNLSRLSLVFESDTKEQRVLSIDNVKRMLEGKLA